MGWIRFLIRFPLTLIYVLISFILLVLLHVFGGQNWFQSRFGKKVIVTWLRLFVHMYSMKLYVEGKPEPGLLVANHISWLDIHVVLANIASRFVSKESISRWPVLGLLPKWSGTFFLQRGSAAAVSRLNTEIVEALRQGDTVAVFPEGTTHDGTRVHRFYSAILQAGLDAGTKVQALAIRYERAGKRDTVMPFIDNEPFVSNVLRILKSSGTHVHLYFCPAFIPDETNRKELAEHLRAQIQEQFDKHPLDG